jgi:WD40 repeat protein
LFSFFVCFHLILFFVHKLGRFFQYLQNPNVDPRIFFSEGQYIVAGSDDGKFFCWDKSSGNIVRVMKGDESIVNCLQSHPTSCVLATSGIDHVVRIWAPQPQVGIDGRGGPGGGVCVCVRVCVCVSIS